MSKMNYSGVKWIGNIPENWIIKKLKYLKNNEKNSFVDGDWIDSEYIEDIGIRYYTTGNIGDGVFKEQGSGFISEKTFKDLKCKYIFPGDLIFSRLNAPYGRSCILPRKKEKCIISVDNVVLRTNEDKRFLCYVTQTEGYHKAVEDYSNGSTMQRISRINLGNVILPLPSKKEQKLIADFLDNKTNILDDIIIDLVNQIEILNKYKKQLISEAVTKGLNKNAKLKSSNIDWINNIPEHWAVKPLKYMFSMYAGGDVDEYDFSVAREDNYIYPIYSNSLEKKGLFGFTSKYRFSGKTFTVTGRGDVGYAIPRFDKYFPVVRLLVCVPKNNDDNRYYSYCVNSANVIGDQTAMAQLTTQRLGMVKVPHPPIDEQKEIADYLDKKCSEIEEILNSKIKQKEQMEQYKKSIIYEYVTGKKRVKGAEKLYE